MHENSKGETYVLRAKCSTIYGETKAMTDEKRLSKLDIDGVKARMATVRGQMTLLGRDVAELYGVATREINQAVRTTLAIIEAA